MDGDLTFNMAGFYSDFDNPQIGISNPGALTANGPQLRIYGLEVESVYKASSNVSLFFSGNLTEAEYTKGMSVFAVAGAPADYQDLAKGNRPPNVPSLSFSTGADFATRWTATTSNSPGRLRFSISASAKPFRRTSRPANWAAWKCSTCALGWNGSGGRLPPT